MDGFAASMLRVSITTMTNPFINKAVGLAGESEYLEIGLSKRVRSWVIKARILVSRTQMK